jgi:REP element-mobilizing transposase RayT
MDLSEAGRLAEQALLDLSKRIAGLRIDAHVIMPNHAHVLIEIGTAASPGVQTPTLGLIVRQWKAASCHLIRSAVDSSFGWQRNYYERIVRDHEDLENIRAYIANNPMNWDQDIENSENVAQQS